MIAKNRPTISLRRGLGYAIGALYALIYSVLTPNMPRWFFAMQWALNMVVWGSAYGEVFVSKHEWVSVGWVAYVLTGIQFIGMLLGMALVYAKSLLSVFDYLKSAGDLSAGFKALHSLPHAHALLLSLWGVMAFIRVVPTVVFSRLGYQKIWQGFLQLRWSDVGRALKQYLPLILLAGACIVAAIAPLLSGGVGLIVDMSQALGWPVLITCTPYWLTIAVLAQGMAEAVFILASNVHKRILVASFWSYIGHLSNHTMGHVACHAITVVCCLPIMTLCWSWASWGACLAGACSISFGFWMHATAYMRQHTIALFTGCWFAHLLHYAGLIVSTLFVMLAAYVLGVSAWMACAVGAIASAMGLALLHGVEGVRAWIGMVVGVSVASGLVLPASMGVLTPMIASMVGYAYGLMAYDILKPKTSILSVGHAVPAQKIAQQVPSIIASMRRTLSERIGQVLSLFSHEV